MDGALGYVFLVLVGIAAGAVNTLAGGGSLLSLPLLILLGLPAALANATNRVGILAQNVGALVGFWHYGVRDLGRLGWGAVPAAAGAAVGTWLALGVGEVAFRRLVALLVLGIAFGSLWNPPRHRRPRGTLPVPALVAGFFAVGVYGGFVQAGVGFLILALAARGGLDLVRGNAVKALCVLVFTWVALGIFAWHAKVDWPAGLALAGGNLVGGPIGAHLAVLKGQAWVRSVVRACAVALAIGLWLG
jgi:hypothetical protein